jgi:drug/metabolite transporter (DMT)-like permease
MKVALDTFDPFTLSALRNGIAALVLLVYSLICGFPPPKTKKEWVGIFWISFHLTTVSSICFTFGLQYVSASLASVLVNTMPFFMVLFARAFLSESPTKGGIFGLLFGFGGAILIASPTGYSSAINPIGLVSILLAAATWASGSVLIKKTGLVGPHAPFCVAVQLTMSFVCLSGISLWQEGLTSIDLTTLGVASLLYGSIPGLAIPFLMWSEILRRGSAIKASATAYLVPLFAIACGFFFLGDRLTLQEMIGGLLIISGVGIVNAPSKTRA